VNESPQEQTHELIDGVVVKKHSPYAVTLRDQFAMAALHSVNVTYEVLATDNQLPDGMRQSQALAKYAYEIADAMLKAREK